MDNQHRKIRGYRDLSQEEINLINRIKEKGEEMGELIDELENMNLPRLDAGQTDGRECIRWILIGKTHIQQGLMALTRSVALPGFF